MLKCRIGRLRNQSHVKIRCPFRPQTTSRVNPIWDLDIQGLLLRCRGTRQKSALKAAALFHFPSIRTAVRPASGAGNGHHAIIHTCSAVDDKKFCLPSRCWRCKPGLYRDICSLPRFRVWGVDMGVNLG